MIYSFACPAPCDRKIKVEAHDNLDAIEKIITAGAISCRNSDTQCSCSRAQIELSPIPEEQLRNIVSLCMREECDASLGG
ncbi:MAG: hypothetical protein ACYDAA_07085 [Syntrophales bacterium]